jgi:hypothetical protein
VPLATGYSTEAARAHERRFAVQQPVTPDVLVDTVRGALRR